MLIDILKNVLFDLVRLWFIFDAELSKDKEGSQGLGQVDSIFEGRRKIWNSKLWGWFWEQTDQEEEYCWSWREVQRVEGKRIVTNIEKGGRKGERVDWVITIKLMKISMNSRIWVSATVIELFCLQASDSFFLELPSSSFFIVLR